MYLLPTLDHCFVTNRDCKKSQMTNIANISHLPILANKKSGFYILTNKRKDVPSQSSKHIGIGNLIKIVRDEEETI